MKWGWANVSVVAMALALGGCCPDQNDDQGDGTLYCNLSAEIGGYPTTSP